MKYDLFISYSRADYWDKKKNVIPGNIVSQIVDTLEAYQRHYNFEYFFDQEAIESRAAYLKRIASAIDESKVMLFVASKSSYSSEFCSKELNFADKRGIPIFQYCIDDAKTPLDIELLLGTHQFRSSKHYPVEKIVQDALSEALGRKIKPLSELSRISSHPTTTPISVPKTQRIPSLPTSIFKRIAGFVKNTFVTIAVVAFSLFLFFWTIGTIVSDDNDKATATQSEQTFPPLIDKNITPIEIDSSLTASQLRAKGWEFQNKKDYNSAVQYYHRAALMGYDVAQTYLGWCYYNGHGVTQDYYEAVKWYRKAAEQGDAGAQCNLGYCYESGHGVTKDYAEAIKWYRKAAEQGLADAQYNLGNCYINGYGVSQDYIEAVKWYRKAAEQGDAGAQCNLGYSYESGQGVTKDIAEAVKWYRKAAEQGNADAQCNLGYCYESGRGVTKSITEAVKWYRKAAEQGHARAQNNLGYCYENGRGVTKSIPETVMWYRKAAEQGHEKAKENLRKLGY